MFESEYKRRLAEALERKAKVTDEIAFLRLQIRQEAKQERWAKGSPLIRQFKAQWPAAEIDNGAGLTYITLRLSVLDPAPDLPGWIEFRRDRVDASLGSPTITMYKMPGMPVNLYVYKAVR